MLFRDVVDLLTVSRVSDGGGGYTETETSRQVFANKKSIRQSEFYQAHATGLKPEIMFEIREAEYADVQSLKYNGKRYQIIRTYSKNGEILELICSRGVGSG